MHATADPRRGRDRSLCSAPMAARQQALPLAEPLNVSNNPVNVTLDD
jgi:hypothetical protein